jgi:hypothetical protein
MKKVLFIFLLVGLVVPTVFANTYLEISFGAGASQLGNGHLERNPFTGGGSPVTATFPTNSFDLFLAGDQYWSLNHEYTIWFGLGSTLIFPVSYSQNSDNAMYSNYFSSPISISFEAPFLFDVASWFSFILKPSLLLVTNHDTDDNHLVGGGLEIAVGPVLYFNENRTVGICALIGYKGFIATGEYGNSGSQIYKNQGWYAIVGVTILIGNHSKR